MQGWVHVCSTLSLSPAQTEWRLIEIGGGGKEEGRHVQKVPVNRALLNSSALLFVQNLSGTEWTPIK